MYFTLILKKFNECFSNYRDNINVLKWLYREAPIQVYIKRDITLLLNDFNTFLSDDVTEWGVNTELVILNMLEGILANSNSPLFVLTFLLNQSDKNQSILEKLFYKVDNKFGQPNFTKLVFLIYNIWKDSQLSKLDNSIYKDSDAPILLPYKQTKQFGFYFSNVDIKFNLNYLDVKLVEAAEYELREEYSLMEKGIVPKYYKVKDEVEYQYKYHPYQPIYITPITESAIDFPTGKIPAFFLLANENIQFWSNVLTGVEYTLDALTLMSGVGNIAKFRHLTKVVEVASRLKKVNVVKYVTKVRIVKLASGSIELASGALNMLMKISNSDSKLARAIQEYLTILEILTLSGELTVLAQNAFRKRLRDAARRALNEKDEIDHLFSRINNPEEAEHLYDAMVQLAEELGESFSLISKSGLSKYGTTKASKIALAFRRTLKDMRHGGNIAVFEFIDNTGKKRIKAFTTFKYKSEWVAAGFPKRKRPHAEDVGIKRLSDNKINYKNVKGIYSELEPCELYDYCCKIKLGKYFPNAIIEFNFVYPGDDIIKQWIRKESIKMREKVLENLLK